MDFQVCFCYKKDKKINRVFHTHKGKFFMAFISNKITFIVIFFLILILPLKSFAETKSQCITTNLKKIKNLNTTILKVSDEEPLDKIIDEKNTLLTDLFICIEENPDEIINTPELSSRIRFLKTRISTNRSLNNIMAVQRDQMEINTVKIKQHLAGFLLFIMRSIETHADQDMIITRAEIEWSFLEQLPPVETRKEVESGKIANELKGKIFELRVLSATYSDIIFFTMENITTIFTKSWLYYIHMETSIDTINKLKSMRNINRVISPFGLNMGRLVAVSVILLVLLLFIYPLFFKCSDLAAAAIAKRQDSSNSKIFHTQIRRPFRMVILFIGIDIALQTFFYQTGGRIYILPLIYCVYSLLCLYFFFNLIDAIAIIQLKKHESRNLRDEIINILIKLTKFVVFIIILSIVLNHFGIKMTAILSTLGIGGLAFALAAKDSLSNLFGGITILLDDLFRQGEWIKIQDIEGTVVEVGVRSTTVRTFANALVTVPNATIANFHVVNWSRRDIGRRIKMHIGVTYESAIQDVKNAVKDIRHMLEQHPDIENPGYNRKSSSHRRYSAKRVSENDLEGIKNAQMVYFDRYSDFSMDIFIYCFSTITNWQKWLEVKEDILYKIHEILKDNNLEFAYPTEVHINKRPEKKGE
jgi:MscS family membrane protein